MLIDLNDAYQEEALILSSLPERVNIIPLCLSSTFLIGNDSIKSGSFFVSFARLILLEEFFLLNAAYR